MNDAAAPSTPKAPITRERALHALYEAAELEHNLMCTYLYAAFSLKDGEAEGLAADEAAAVGRWRKVLIRVAVEEMQHLAAVWNITSALGGAPRIGRTNFPLDPGMLPAGIVVKLAPFSPETLQHFVFLERPKGSTEVDGEGFVYERNYVRGSDYPYLTPMGINYDTVGDFYAALSNGLRSMVAQYGEAVIFAGDPALQLSQNEINMAGCKPVICVKTALAAFDAIVVQGEGAPADSADSHYQKFLGVREEYRALKAKNPNFSPAFPAATNPVLRRPPRPEGRVWLENPDAIAVVDLANASYGLMLRLLAYAYALPAPCAEKSLSADLAIGLMQAMVPLAERAARLPAGPSNPHCHGGVSFTALRDAAALPPGRAARRFFVERFTQLSEAADALRASGDQRVLTAADLLGKLAKRAARGFDLAAAAPTATAAVGAGTVAGAAAPAGTAAPPASAGIAAPPASAGIARASNGGQPAAASAGAAAPAYTNINGMETARGEKLDLLFETKRCIHARFCVTGAPDVFLANTPGEWLHPDAMEVERVVEIAHACPSGAVQYRRRDGVHNETAPPVNLASIRESGPYAVRGQLELDGEPIGFRATLCRCGASKNKPFCDGSHHEVKFSATGEPDTVKADPLAVRNGVLAIDPQLNGPLSVRGNLEITSGTGRIVSRVTAAKLCRCGGSATKPFCDGTHARIGFKST
ncbi:MAG: CDGSH iron-sulfur domain-containing protein [Proteobacteria bacterium]|nr:CDGSH iron-sulfur domain-containing protein [Pseudomonadota bacterium]